MFLQIGAIAINVNHIESVQLDRDRVTVFTSIYDNAVGEQRYYEFTGEEAEAFRRWWDEKADVHVIL